LTSAAAKGCGWGSPGCGLGQFVPEQTRYEGAIFLASSDRFGNREVMDLEAKPGSTPGVGIAHRHKPFLPFWGQSRRFKRHTVGLAECLVTWRLEIRAGGG
jgi:hypothetical protein